jgi:hypothetical protein
MAAEIVVLNSHSAWFADYTSLYFGAASSHHGKKSTPPTIASHHHFRLLPSRPGPPLVVPNQINNEMISFTAPSPSENGMYWKLV